ncbi:MAG: GNAT family N-acetyltransferase [Nanoarchaeota archaeon]|nr:GNAT family N-acetyltransferase [Nanoarchaeota archaeon]
MIIELNQESEEWNTFLKNNNHRIYHTPKFKTFIEDTFRLRPKYIAYKEDNIIRTILPLTPVHSKIFGNRLISVAMLEYGGFAGDESHTNKIIDYIKERYKQKYDYAEIRQGLDKFNNLNLENKRQKRFILHLNTSEELWKNIQKEKRKAIKKSKKNLFTRELTIKDINKIYKLYLNNMRKFGTPPSPKKFFINFFKLNLGKCFGSFLDGKLTAFLLGYTYKDRIHVIIANAYSKYLKYRSNDAVHWAFIEWGCHNNFQIFDFGIVRENSGHFEYKRKWGAELKDLNRHIIYLKKDKIKDPNPEDPKLQTILKIYRKLPVNLTIIAGKIFRKGLGI